MDNKESNSLEGIRTDISWIKKTLNDISSELRSFPMAIDAINKRIDTAESSVQTLREKMENHLVVATELAKEHQVNTDFRKNSEFLISIGKYLVPGSVVLNLMVTAILIIKDEL